MIKKKPVANNIQIDSKKDLIDFFGISEPSFKYYFRKVKGEESYKKLIINKASGKPRTIHAVSRRLKKIQCIALEKLQAVEKFQPSSYAHGFTPGKSIITNAICHRRSKRIIKMDLKDFFPSIHFGRVRGMFMAYQYEFGKDAATIMAQLACLDDATGILPQGGSLSPYIANMMCRRLDKRLAQVARDHRCNFTRYADDITFSTNDTSQENIDDLIEATSRVIDSEHFVVNTDKTKILTSRDRQVVTGIIVNDGINVNRRYIRNLRATIRNCEKFGIASQIEKKIFRDSRCSRPNKFATNQHHPSVDYFLRHLFGKINFFGSVVLSNNQDQKNLDNPSLYKRIQTYENILFRFHSLLKNPKVKVDPSIKKSARSAIYRRPKLAARLSIIEQGKSIKVNTLRKFRESLKVTSLQARLDLINSESELDLFVKEIAEKDARFFNISVKPDVQKTKIDFKEILSYPPIDSNKVQGVLKSLKTNEGLKKLVHENSPDLSVSDCYEVLCEHYDPIVYFLPKLLKDDFEFWKDNLGKAAEKNGESYLINVIKDPIIANATKQLKINTRFGRNTNESSHIVKKIQGLIKDIGLSDDKVKILITSHGATFYTHTPSILKSINKVLQSMSLHTDKADTIYIDLSKRDKVVELRVFDDSKKGVHNELLNDRDFAHGKLSDVVQLTNGLCKYWIESTLEDETRKILNMHDGSEINKSELSDLKHGFAHRFIFQKIS